MGGTFRKLAAASAVGVIAVVGLIGCGDGAAATPPQQVADQITQNETALREAIDSWRAAGDPPSSAPPAEVAFLGDHPNLASRVMPLLGGSLRAEIRRLYAARRALLRLSAGTKPKKLKLGRRPPLADLVGFYDEAEGRIGIGANYLAAIHLVETKFGRVVNNSVAGAQGPMQLMPATPTTGSWRPPACSARTGRPAATAGRCTPTTRRASTSGRSPSTRRRSAATPTRSTSSTPGSRRA